MEIRYQIADPFKTHANVLLVAATDKGVEKTPYFRDIANLIGKEFIVEDAASQDFKGKSGSAFGFSTLGHVEADRIVYVGVGSARDVDDESWFMLGGHMRRQADAVGAETASIVPHKAPNSAQLANLLRGFELGGYRYTEYLSDKGRGSKLSELTIVLPKGTRKPTPKVAAYAEAVAAGAALARDLVNESPLQLYPETFGKKAAAMAKANGIKCKVYTPAELKKMKMNLMLGVGQGSERKPRMVHLTYTPARVAKSAKPIVLVGKGVTFDSGGLSLKPSAAMDGMKMDMGGGAAVMGAMLAIAKLKPKVPVHGIVGLSENMPSGSAIRPGDVITGAAGKSVEINNTDAEGRLVLADALHFATGLNPAYIVDLATLTGACMVALGNYTVGTFSNDDALAKKILKSASAQGESFWHMPLNSSLRAQLNSDCADMKNTGERWGGAITAGLFLKEFVGDNKWAHLDIAGPVTSSKVSGPYCKGGTGVGVSTLVHLITGGV